MSIASVTLKTDDSGALKPPIDKQLGAWAGDDPQNIALANLIKHIAVTAIPLAHRLAQGCLPGNPSAIVGVNESGDKQKALDVAAHDHFVAALRGMSVASILSEEAEETITFDPNGRFDVAMDPIDGSGSIGIGAPLGMLFCVFPAGQDFLRTGRDIIAAGYISFGHSVDMGFSVGNGVTIATLDINSGRFVVDEADAKIPKQTSTAAFNISYLRRWSSGIQNYIQDLLQGNDGPRGQNFNMRWIGAAVGDLHRILRRGGVFLYPADNRPGYENGFLRLAYEAFPIAYLIEQAGGAANNGTKPILDLAPTHPHDRVPLFFGSCDEIEQLLTYITTPTTDRNQ